jgi:hypothetical protein
MLDRNAEYQPPNQPNRLYDGLGRPSVFHLDAPGKTGMGFANDIRPILLRDEEL